jgi:hypothetical protein
LTFFLWTFAVRLSIYTNVLPTVAALGLLTLALNSAASANPVQRPLVVLSGRADGLVPAVAGTIHGRSLWFDLDTGALRTYLDAAAARSLDLTAKGTAAVTGAGKGSVSAVRLHDVDVHLGAVTFRARQPWAIDLSHVGSTLSEQGILGFDFFRSFVVAIDFGSYRVTLYDPMEYRYAGIGTPIPLVIRPPRAYVAVTVSAKGVAPEHHLLRLDMGSSDGVDDDIVLRSSSQKRPITGGVGIGGKFKAYLGTVSVLQIGPYKLYDLPSATGGVQLIGDEVWHRFNVVLDFSRSVMYLTPRHSDSAEPRRNGSR